MTWAVTSSRIFVAKGQAHVYDFSNNDVPGSTERDKGYWRDVGTIDAFYEAHMDLIPCTPSSTCTTSSGLSAPPTWVSSPPAKFVQGGIAPVLHGRPRLHHFCIHGA